MLRFVLFLCFLYIFLYEFIVDHYYILYKTHFIIENDTYNDFRNIMNKLQKSAQCNKKTQKTTHSPYYFIN
ncbi:plasmid maintenance protein [Borrelia duttonii]|uniref:plasmid maintenance protein n=1 Tax=Borrelia duttonii TaxID=40834 RepID=UPI00117E4591